MEFDDGINPEAIEEEDSNVSQASAGSDLFTTSNKEVYKVETNDLFSGNSKKVVTSKEDNELFTSQIEHALSSASSQDIGYKLTNVLAIIICIVLIITYIYYLVQKRSIKNQIEISKQRVMSIN